MFAGRSDGELKLNALYLMEKLTHFERTLIWERLRAKEETAEDEMVGYALFKLNRHGLGELRHK